MSTRAGGKLTTGGFAPMQDGRDLGKGAVEDIVQEKRRTFERRQAIYPMTRLC
jgi:hypothetical protein